MVEKPLKKTILMEYNDICLNHNICTLDRESFHQFINGLYQAEGTTGAYFSKEKSLAIRFIFSIGQNYSSEALNVFLNLQKILGIGRVKLEFNSRDQPHVRYVVSNTEDIISKVLPYFSLLYGQKRKDRCVLLKIYKLSLDIIASQRKEVELNKTLVCEFLHLIYSINPEGQKRKLSLFDKLQLFGCESLVYSSSLDTIENDSLPSKLFIIGLFLGDGSFGFVFDAPPLRSPRFYVKIVFNFAAQSNTDDNILLLSLVAEKMNLKPQIYKNKEGMIGLQYSGDMVSKTIMPFLKEHED